MEKYQPDLQITLEYLNKNSIRYIIPGNIFAKIEHPKYKIFTNHEKVILFPCKKSNSESCFLNLDDKREFVFLNSFFLSVRAQAEKNPEINFYIEDFRKHGFFCCENDWLLYQDRFEKDLKEFDNVIFLWNEKK